MTVSRPAAPGPLDTWVPPPSGRPDFAALDAPPYPRAVHWDGPERGLVAALRTRPHVTALTWTGARGRIDLSGTAVRTLRLIGAARAVVCLSDDTDTVEVAGRAGGVRFDGPDRGRGVHLTLRDGPDGLPWAALPAGLDDIRGLDLRTRGTVDAAVLADLAELTELSLTFRTLPGAVEPDHDPLWLPRLRRLSVDGGVDLDPDLVASAPSLREVRLTRVRASTADAVTAALAGSGATVQVTDVLPDAWLDEQRAARARFTTAGELVAALRAQQAHARAEAAVAGPGTATEPALRRFVAELTAIDEEYGVVTDAEWEHAYALLRDLGRRTGLPDDVIDAVIDGR